MKRSLIIFFSLFSIINCYAQNHLHPVQKSDYSYPTDSLVNEKLEQWQDLKFGFMMHWGLYAQLGTVESWGLCSEDQSFQDRGDLNYIDYKNMYFDLITKFNPQQFDPVPWAKAAKDAGMKYLVFTTKHHDGFSMFDTKYSDFKITGNKSPFKNHPKSNVTKEIFESFRKQGFMIGTYFSKPDWHHPSYWSPLLATPNRSNNYDTRKYPERWKDFQNFAFNQVEELMTDYGKVDILWLDGGWVRPDSTINEEVISWGYDIPKWEQDINMPRIAKMARKKQPGILIVDRTVHGPYENYRTPEQKVPENALPFPWETNMTMTQEWGHSFNPKYKSTKLLIHTLIDVVSKGGNFLLNVGPTPYGTIEEEAYKRLAEIGDWMKINGEGLYATRQWKYFKEGENIRFTQSKNNNTIFIFLFDWPKSSLKLAALANMKVKSVKMLGYSKNIKTEKTTDGFIIHLPKEMNDVNKRPSKYANVLKVNLK